MIADSHESSFGRRNYDVEIAKLQFQVLALQKENEDLKLEFMAELKEMRVDVREMSEAWKSAKGLTAFIKWLAAIAAAIGILVAAAKGFRL